MTDADQLNAPGRAQGATDPMATVDWVALGAALVTVVLWASAFVGIRAVADDLSPGAKPEDQ